jgi:hypothetical protein
MSYLFVGHLISIFLVAIGIVFLLIGIYNGFKTYDELPHSKNIAPKFFYLSVFSFSSSLFIFLTFENGFTWDTVCVSGGLAITLTILVSLDSFIRTTTATYLQKRNAFLQPSASWKLIKRILRTPQSDTKTDANKDNNK